MMVRLVMILDGVEEKVKGQNEFLLDDGRASQEVLRALEKVLDDQETRP